MQRPIVPPPEPTERPAAAPPDDATAPAPDDLEQRLDRLIAARLEAAETQRAAKERQSRLERFAAGHPDFAQLKAAGMLDALRAGNPILDDVGAYLVHHLENERREKAQTVEKARQDAAAAAEAALLERVKTKRLAATLDTALGGPGRGQASDPELGAPERFGGLTSVLTARLAARRKHAGN